MNTLPKLHNATWPGLVGKGPDSEPVIAFDQLLEMTAAAEVGGVKFDGIDVGLLEPHIYLDQADEAKKLAEKVSKHGLKVGSLVAPIWAGSAMGTADQRKTFVEMVRKSCEFGQQLKSLGVRDYGIVRIDSAAGVSDWAKDPLGNSKLIAQLLSLICKLLDLSAGTSKHITHAKYSIKQFIVHLHRWPIHFFIECR